jgi:hypothetical protein
MDQASLARQWGESLADPSGTDVARIVAPDVVLEGSAFAQPIRGRQAVWATLRAAAGIYDTIAFTSDAEHDDHVYLDWVATGLGLSIAGVTVLHTDHSGRAVRRGPGLRGGRPHQG